eukprot:1978794-Pyramimonas_sp.AAC.2
MVDMQFNVGILSLLEKGDPTAIASRWAMIDADALAALKLPAEAGRAKLSLGPWDVFTFQFVLEAR